MLRFQAGLFLLTIARAAAGETLTVTPPQRGFEKNAGQYSNDILFALDQRIFYQNRVQLATGLSLQFSNASASLAVSGQDPRAFPLNLYLGSDPKKWLENVPHFTTVRYAQVYPGIDVEFNADVSTNGGTPFVRVLVAAGANPQQVVMSLLPGQVYVSHNQIQVYSPVEFTLGNLRAYQSQAGVSAVPVSFVQVDQNSFSVAAAAYNSSLPLVIEFGDPYCSCLSWNSINVGSGNSIGFSGNTYSGPSYLAKVQPDGTPAFLSLFDYVLPVWLTSDQKGGLTVAGGLAPSAPSSAPPVTADAPLPTRSASSEVWLGRFNSNGKLVSSTYTGGAKAFALDQDGSVYFSTASSVDKWVPGQTHFGFSVTLSNVISLATNQHGELAFAATGSAGQYTTVGAMKSEFEGEWTQYAGKLNPSSGAILMATYAAVIGSDSGGFTASTSVALAPGGSLWLASTFFLYPDADAFTLVAVSGDGTRVIDSEAVHGPASVAFDPEGNALVVLSSDFPVSPTALDAPLRVPCFGESSWYYMKRAPNGSLLSATYLKVNANTSIATFDGPDRLFLASSPYVYSSYSSPTNVVSVDLGPPAQPEIACLISPASRTTLNQLVPGELVTISGYHLGPVQEADASLGASGQLPTQLAGVQVTINQVPMPLVSVQQGAITFYLPETTPSSFPALEIQLNGVKIASLNVTVGGPPRFAVFTADGSGIGPLAAINQDGTLNADYGAPGGSVVSIFGIGTTPLANVSYVSVEYAGPAPGLVPGVKQVNVRLPKDFKPSPGSDFVRLYISPAAPNGIQRVEIRGLH